MTCAALLLLGALAGARELFHPYATQARLRSAPDMVMPSAVRLDGLPAVRISLGAGAAAPARARVPSSPVMHVGVAFFAGLLGSSLAASARRGGAGQSALAAARPRATVPVMQRRRPRPAPAPPKDKTPINDAITAEEMRVLVDAGSGQDEMLGVMTKEEALAAAQERDLDLVLVAGKELPVVCKIISYDKYRFALEKRKKEQKKAAARSKSELKELKMSYKIGEHDYEVRKKQAVKFLSGGDKVKFSMQFKGREITHNDVGKGVLLKMAGELEEYGILDATPKVMGRTMVMMISPKPRA